MSCEACSQAQQEPRFAYFRWKNANVELRGCDQHLREVFAVLRAEQAPPGTPWELLSAVHEARAALEGAPFIGDLTHVALVRLLKLLHRAEAFFRLNEDGGSR